MTIVGKRPGAGHKPGSVNRMSAKAREAAKATGELPHEFLLRVSRGERIEGYAPTFTERMDAAKAAAPYFAARLTAATVSAELREPPKRAADYTDEELAAIVSGAGLAD